MRKIIVLVIILMLGAGLTGCGKKKTEQVNKSAVKSEKPGLRVTENNTLMGWLKRGKVVECRLSVSGGEIMIRAKKNNVRIDGIAYAAPNSEKGDAGLGTNLTVNDTMYLWAGAEGTKMDLKKLKEMAEEEDGSKQETWEEMVADWENADIGYECRAASVPDSLFLPPTDVIFTDLTAVTEGFVELGKELKESVDSGETPNMEELERQMDEMQKQPQE